ncbi:CamS family sex pheromone protein [uncultured bacterium]|nr:CamS family sex pheromone protein [uncultured bacterium]
MEVIALKKLKVFLAIASSALILGGCGLGNLSSRPSSNNGTQLTGHANNSNYQSVIKHGHYLTSKSRGVDVQQDANQLNLKSFENGLLDLSKKEFPTNKYIFQEGQHISTKTTEHWLDRKSQNSQGLNPSGKETKVPLYLQQMDEQDFLTQHGKHLKLSGMTVGLGINSIYYYKKKKYGPTYKKSISNATVKAEGHKIGAKVLARLRRKPGLKHIPIVIGLYRQGSDDSLVGGNFFAYSVNKGSSIDGWKPIDERNYVFPSNSGDKGKHANDANDFSNFKSRVQNFFPNLSGVTAQAYYINGSLSGMHVNITTQFYSQTEIIAFTQYLQTAAKKYLPSGMPIDITVKSTEGVQSFLARKSGSKSFSAHVFNSY